MSSILFFVPDPVSTAGWNSIFDNTKWQDSAGANRAYNQWDGGNTRWVQQWEAAGEAPEDSSSRLAVNGSWYTDFRTVNRAEGGEFRITMSTGGFDPKEITSIVLSIGGDSVSTVYQGDGGGPSSRVWVATDINLDPGNIEHIHFTKPTGEGYTGNVYIENIEFYYDTDDPTPGGDWGDGAGG